MTTGSGTEQQAKPNAPQGSVPAAKQGSTTGHGSEGQGYQAQGPAGAKAMGGGPIPPPSMPPNVAYDLSLQHPRCVYQLLKQQYSRYTPEMVSRITGIPQDQLLKAYDMYTSIRKDGDTKKVATIIYAVGLTQHSFGTQMIRTAAMLQLLMGNVGRAGGGVNALRGHSNIQGATDMAGIFDILPGYLKMPTPADKDLKTYLDARHARSRRSRTSGTRSTTGRTRPSSRSRSSRPCTGPPRPRRTISASTGCPRSTASTPGSKTGTICTTAQVKGVFAFGMNGVMIGPDSQKNIDALKKADFLVVCEIYPDETSEFWKAPGTTPEEMKQIQTTVYRLPGAGFAEKGWNLRQLGALAAVEECRPAASGRLPPRSGHPGANLPQGPRALQEGRRKVPRSDLERLVDVHHADEPFAGRGGEGDQRQGAGRHRGREDQGLAQSRTAAARLRHAARRRHHHVRQLALLRLVDAKRAR